MKTGQPTDQRIQISYAQIFRQFLRFGFLAWGGPVAQIAMLKEEFVDREKLITPEKFKRVLAVYQVLPGPEAQELCVYFGMLKGKRLGGFLAGLGFMLPGFILILLFSWLYVTYGNSVLILGAAYGIQPAVVAIVAKAVHRIGSHVIVKKYMWLILAVSIIATVLQVHFAIILGVSGVLAIIFSRKRWALGCGVAVIFLVSALLHNSAVTNSSTIVSQELKPSTAISYLTTGLKGGLLTFGGAYTILPFLEADAVNNYQWLSQNQLADGIALTNMLPAPLVIVATFVGYLGNEWLGAGLITIGVFLPAFAFTLLGHSFLERLTHNTKLHNFLDGVAVGVIGLMILTALHIGVYVIQTPVQVIVAIITLLILFVSKFKFTIPLVVIGAGAIGLVYSQLL